MAPEVLYKYSSLSTAEVVLTSGKLRWSSPSVFNDVHEFQRMPRFEPSIAESAKLITPTLYRAAKGELCLQADLLEPKFVSQLELARSLLEHGFTEEKFAKLFPSPNADHMDEHVAQATRDVFEQRMQGTRVLCLTETFDNDVLWGNYADNHRGIVFGLRAVDGSSPFSAAVRITYSDEPVVVGDGLEFWLYGGQAPGLNHRTRNAVAFTKKKLWAYEQEWRLITGRPNESGCLYGDYTYQPEELESVTIGARTDSVAATRVVELVREKYPSAHIFKMDASNGQLSRKALD